MQGCSLPSSDLTRVCLIICKVQLYTLFIRLYVRCVKTFAINGEKLYWFQLSCICIKME